MQTSLIFSLLFFIAYALYLVFGIYTLKLRSGTGLNRVFFAVCLSLCFWSLGFSIASSAPTWEVCFLWRRVAALGWGTIYSLLLHYFIMLTTNQHFHIRWKYCTLIHLPAAVSIYVFGISETMAVNEYNFIQTRLGWTNVSPQTPWNKFFRIYYVGYILTCLFLILRWKKHHPNDHKIRKQANLFLVSIMAAFLLGSLTDVILAAATKSPVPQMAPIFTLLPVGAIYLSMRRYKLMAESPREEKNTLLTNEAFLKMQSHVGFAYLIGGMASIVSHFFPDMVNSDESMLAMLHGGIIMSFMGAVTLSAQLIKDNKLKEKFLLIVMLCSIPLITVQFTSFASITIWVFPLVLMVASLVFTSRKYLASITVTSVITQVLVWINAPKGFVCMDEFDYILRIIILIVTFMVGSFVNETYINKMEESLFQIRFQKLVSDVSADLISINQVNMTEKLTRFSDKIGQFFQVDHCYIFLIDECQKTMTCVREWCNQGISPMVELTQDVSVNAFPCFSNELSINKLIHMEDVNDLPDSADTEKKTFARNGIKSIMAISIEQDDKTLGFIGLDSVTTKKKWPPYHIELLKLLANLVTDALMRIESEKTIEYMAYYDPLTKLPNRALFSDRLSQSIQLAKRNERFVGVIFLDLDGFKMVNDTMGHSGGDALLKEISQGLVASLRKTDTVARFGGDEFLILVNNLNDEGDIIKVADTVMDLFKHPFFIYGQEFHVTASVGIATYPFDGKDTETLIKNADIAMYMAKENGKNQYVMCTSDMKKEVKRNIELSNQLYRAQEKGELILHYQPQIRLTTGKIVGLEALVRWDHPELGMIFPDDFIPLAEMNGTIIDIGEWVLETAIRQNKKWQAKGFPPVRISVNLSAVQFSNPGFVDRVKSILKHFGLEPHYLELEITERVATRESSHIISALGQLKKFGVSISIDDFGTEYSSLSRLKTLPIDRIKIDMQFIHGIEGSEKDQAITKVIISLAKNLGLQVLAEGVETANQLNFLNQKMCDEVQGYFYYRPMPAEEIENLFRIEMLNART